MIMIVRFLVILLSAAPTGFSVGIGLDLDDLLGADLIARVTIVAVTDGNSDPGYTRLAHATVTDSAKGAKVGEALDLLSSPEDTIRCGPIHYEVGDDCIVVARRRSTGGYETMNGSAGKYEILGGEYINPFWFRVRAQGARSEQEAATEYRRTDFKNKTPEEILQGLRRLLPEVEREIQSKRDKRWWRFWR